MAEVAEVHNYGHGWILRWAGLGRQHGDTRGKHLSETKDCPDDWGVQRGISRAPLGGFPRHCVLVSLLSSREPGSVQYCRYPAGPAEGSCSAGQIQDSTTPEAPGLASVV